jgi:purine-binding chemotaxis protein CheW
VSRRVLVTGDELQFLVFRVGGREFALPITQAERILRYQPGEVLAAGPEFLDGVITHAGTPTPLLDLRRRTGAEPSALEETRVMVLALDGMPLALVVDQVTEVLRVDARSIQPASLPPPGCPPESLGGLISRPGRTIVILNAARLLSVAERRALSEART